MQPSISVFLDSLKSPISQKYVAKLIQAHPDFPSLLSVSDVFYRLGIDHKVTRIDKEKLHEVPYPYLLPLDKGDMVVVRDADSLRKIQPRLDEWGGVILVAEPTTNILDKENNNLYAKEKNIRRNGTLILAAVAGLMLFSATNLTLWENLSLLLALAGTAVGYLLVAKELGISYAAVDAFCNAGKNTNCDRVLKSDVTLLGVNFSDAVLTYFLFQALAIGFSPFLPGHQSISATLSILALLPMPVVAFSIYYQWAVAKTWCRLCLVVDGILILQAMVFGFALYAGTVTPSLSLPVLLPMMAVALIVFLSVIIVKSTMERYEKLGKLGGDGNRVKHSASMFTSLLTKQKQVDVSPFEHEVLLGNPNTPIKVTMVSNLFCNPCKLKHEVIDQLISTYPDNVQVALRFVKSGRDEASVGHLLGYWHQHIYGKQNATAQTAALLHDWFEIWDFEKFKKKYPVVPGNDLTQKLEAQHYAWVEEAQVRLTPTFFVNGHQLPKEYAIDDLLAMAPSLADSFQKSMMNEKTLVVSS
jgi:uncharacterized membrane protein